MAAKDSYTYGDLFFVRGKIDWKALTRYDIVKKRHTISLRIKEGNEHRDYVFALSSAARNEPSIKGIIYKIEVEDKADKAVTAAPGGIDFNADKLNLQAQNNGGEIKFHLGPAMLQHLQNTPGFIPVIIKIQPVDLRTFLGI